MESNAVRKVLALVLASAMMLSLSACENEKKAGDSSAASSTSASINKQAAPGGELVTLKVQDPKEVNYGAAVVVWCGVNDNKANSDVVNLKVKVKKGAAEGNHAINMYFSDMCNDAYANVNPKFNGGEVVVSADGKTNAPSKEVNDEFTLVIPNVSAKAGDEITVPVKVYNNPGFNTMKLIIGYDKEALEIEDITAGSDFPNSSFNLNLNPNVKFVTE
jgi:hypothetical protein